MFAKAAPIVLIMPILLGTVTSAFGQSFATIDVPGAASTYAYGINNSGQIVGVAPNGFLYSGGSFSSINVPGSTYTHAYGISSSGQIVGEYRFGAGTTSHGLIYTGGVPSALDYPGADDTVAAGISSDGQYIVGSFVSGPSSGPNPYHAFVYYQGGFTAAFNAPPCTGVNDRTGAGGVNDSGEVVGSCNGVYGFLYSGGSFTAINFPGATATSPSGINNAGQISGYYSDATGQHGFLYGGGSFTPINYPGATQTAATGINDNGDVVGWYTDKSGVIHGFVYSGVRGYINPKYVVMGVTYAPPGSSSSTFVQYQNSSLVGTSQSLSQSFESSATVSTSVMAGFSIGKVFSGQITTTSSTTASQTTKNTSTVTTSFQTQQGEKTFGTGSYWAPVDHDYDLIWVWLNPAAIFTVYPSGVVVWNGYGFDATDQPDMDIVGLPLGFLNGHFGAMPQFQSSLARAWAANQVFAAGQGPALTSADLAQIASADPFAKPSYGPNYIGSNPPSPETLDHRFTLTSCSGSSGFSYNQAPPSGAPNIFTCTLTYTNTSMQAQELTTTYQQSYSVDQSFTVNIGAGGSGASGGSDASSFLPSFNATVKNSSSQTLTWTTTYQQSITNETTQTSQLSVQGPPCGNTAVGQPCSPVYDAAGNQPTQFAIYQDNQFGTFMFAPIAYNWATSTLTSLSPTSAAAGSSPLTVTLNGSAFVNGSVVLWGGTPLTTTYVSATQLTASVPANLLATPGTVSVIVITSGVASSAVTFTIGISAAPTISSLSPSSAPAGGAAFTLTINGSGFTASSAVAWSATGLTTTYVSATQLTAAVPAALIAASGTVAVTAANPGSIASNVLTFTITSGALTILTKSPLPSATVGVTYSQGLTASGGVTPYMGWSIAQGSSPPPGIVLNSGVLPGTAVLDGTPTSPGTFNFSIQLTDASGITATAQFQLAVAAGLSVVSAASYESGQVSPGEIVAIYGSFPGPSAIASLQLTSAGVLSTNLAGVQVEFDGIQAPMVFALKGQAACIVPYEVSGKSSTQVQVLYQGESIGSISVTVAAVVPAIFTANASGTGQGAIVNEDGTVNSANNPAAIGSIVSLYGTGEGQTSPGGIDGTLDASPLPQPLAQPIGVSIGGLPAKVLYAGGSSGEVAGLLQINVQIPAGVTPGPTVPVVMTIAGAPSQTGVTLAVH